MAVCSGWEGRQGKECGPLQRIHLALPPPAPAAGRGKGQESGASLREPARPAAPEPAIVCTPPCGPRPLHSWCCVNKAPGGQGPRWSRTWGREMFIRLSEESMWSPTQGDPPSRSHRLKTSPVAGFVSLMDPQCALRWLCLEAPRGSPPRTLSEAAPSRAAGCGKFLGPRGEQGAHDVQFGAAGLAGGALGCQWGGLGAAWEQQLQTPI